MFTTSFTHKLTSRLVIPPNLTTSDRPLPDSSSKSQSPSELQYLALKTALSILQDYKGLIRLSPVVTDVHDISSSDEKAVDITNFIEEFHPHPDPSSRAGAAAPPTPTLEAGTRPDHAFRHPDHSPSQSSSPNHPDQGRDPNEPTLSSLPAPDATTDWTHLETHDDLPLLSLPSWLGGWQWKQKLTYYQCVRNLRDGMEGYTDPGSGVRTWGVWRVVPSSSYSSSSSSAAASFAQPPADTAGSPQSGATPLPTQAVANMQRPDRPPGKEGGVALYILEQQVVHCPIWLAWYIRMTMRSSHEHLHRRVRERWEDEMGRAMGVVGGGGVIRRATGWDGMI